MKKLLLLSLILLSGTAVCGEKEKGRERSDSASARMTALIAADGGDGQKSPIQRLLELEEKTSDPLAVNTNHTPIRRPVVPKHAK